MTVNPSVHYLGIVGYAAEEDHSRCAAQWERIKAERADEYGPDGAYNQGGCIHGQEFEGRGDHRDGAANGQQGGIDYNPGSRSICIMVGTEDEIPPACVELIRRWYERQRANGMEAPLLSHSDFVATMCCGDPLRQTVVLVNLFPGPPAPGPSPSISNGGSTMIFLGRTLDGAVWCAHWNGSYIERRFTGALEGPFGIPADALAFHAGSVPVRPVDYLGIVVMEKATRKLLVDAGIPT